MTFRSMRLAESTDPVWCSDASFEDIDAAFDAPRPITVTFQSKAPDVERLYAVEMRAEDVAAGLKKAGGDAEFHEPGAAFAAASTTWRWTSFRPCVGAPTARAATTSAASLPARTAPSMLPKNFCDVKQPQSVKFGIGVFCEGRYLLRPGTAA